MNNNSPQIPIEISNSIKLTKNAKGEYQWEIKINSVNADEIFPKIVQLDRQLNELYCKEVKE